MKKIVKLLLPSLFFCGIAFSQVLLPQSPKDYGKKENRVQVLKALHIPMKTLEILSSDTSAQIFYNPLDSSIWAYSLSKSFFRVSGSATDTSHLSDRINEKLNSSDTANKWLGTVFKRNDSVFFKKGSTEFFAYKDSTGAGGSTDTSHLSARIDDRAKFVDVKDTIQKVLNYLVLDNVSDFASFTGFANSVIVKDSIRGDRFDRYTGPDAADGGMVFADSLTRKWKRWTGNGIEIAITWYGASPSNTPSNNADAFEAARDYIYAHPNNFRRIKVPGNTGIYRISRQIKFTSAVDVVGDEGLSGNVGQQPASKLSWPMNVRGLFWQCYQYPYTVYLKNISAESEFDYVARDTLALIETRVKLHVDNLYIPYASGNGLVYKAALGGDSTTNPIFGDCSYSIVNHVEIHEAITGILTEGADANHIRVNFYESYANKRYGFDDNSTLGCHWNNPSFNGNANGSFTGAATLVTYAGLYYQALPIHDTSFLGIGKRPDLNPLWWREVTPRAALAWDTTKHYWSGGGYILRHPSGESSVMKPYTEGDQPMNNIYGSRHLVLDGTNGAGTMGYGLEKTILGAKYLQYDGVIISNGKSPNYAYLHIGEAAPSPTSLFVLTEVGQQPAWIKSLSSFASIKFNQSADGGIPAYIGYGTGSRSFGIYPGNTGVAFFQETLGIYAGANNTFPNGGLGAAWSEFWSYLPYGIGVKDVRMNPANGKFTYKDTLSFSVGFGLLLQGDYPNYHFIADTSELATLTALRDSAAAIRAASGGSGWGLTGNSGTTAGTNFIGNTDSVDWVIKTNGIERFRIKANGQIYLPNNKFLMGEYSTGSYTEMLGMTDSGRIEFGTKNQDINTRLQAWSNKIDLLDEGINYHSGFHRIYGELVVKDTATLEKVRIASNSDSAYTKDPLTGKIAYAKINGSGGSGATSGQLRRFGSSDVTGTDANITAAAGTVLYLPAATLSTNRTIDVSGLSTDGDYIEIYNNEAGFTWSFTGATVYLLDRTATASTLVVDGVYKIRRVSGKLIINN